MTTRERNLLELRSHPTSNSSQIWNGDNAISIFFPIRYSLVRAGAHLKRIEIALEKCHRSGTAHIFKSTPNS